VNKKEPWQISKQDVVTGHGAAMQVKHVAFSWPREKSAAITARAKVIDNLLNQKKLKQINLVPVFKNAVYKFSTIGTPVDQDIPGTRYN
jgi:hypothetical protein